MYTELDRLIVDAVRNSHGSPLNDKQCMVEATRMAELGHGEDFRIIDRRLQALRKKGQIVYLSGKNKPEGIKAGWYLVENGSN